MEKPQTTDWIKLDQNKLISVRDSDRSSVKSFLTPSKVPTAVRISVVTESNSVRFEYKYAAEPSEEDTLQEYEAHALSVNMKIMIGSQSKRLYSVDVPASELETVKAAAYQRVRESLEGIREEHPRWGTFSAVSNVFARYSKAFDREVAAYA